MADTEYADVAVLGAGISGLSAAVALARGGLRPLVFEAKDGVGGLAATVDAGDYAFDLGGHRWYSRDPEVDAFFRGTMEGELLRVPRISRICMGPGRFLGYPIRFQDVVRLFGIGFGLRAGAGLVRDRLLGRVPSPRAPDAESAYVRNFGNVIYDRFFRDYTERLWGIPCGRLDGRWVGQRSDNLSLLKVIRGFFAKVRDLEAIDDFLYPRGGYGRFPIRMAQAAEAAGARLRTGHRLRRWRKTDGGFLLEFELAGGATRDVEARRVVGTLPLDRFVRACAHEPPARAAAGLGRLRFRDFVVVALHLAQDRYTPDTWLYTQGPGLDFVRLHEPKNWSPDLVRASGTTVVVLEVPCWEGDALWREGDGALAGRLRDQLHAGVAPVTGKLLGWKVVRVKDVYPVYEIGYEADRDALTAWLGTFPGLELAGRNGLFVYDSSDQPVASGLAAARRILADPPGPEAGAPAAILRGARP